MNHHTIEPLAQIFGSGTPPFMRLTSEFRRRVVEEAADSGTCLIVTLVWNLAGRPDAEWVAGLVAPYAEANQPVSFVELSADLGTRLVRNRGEDRLAAKPSKRDLEWSEAHLHERERTFVMNTEPGVSTPAHALLGRHRHLKIDNGDANPGATADRIVSWLADTGSAGTN
jgi:hypothetical protein